MSGYRAGRELHARGGDRDAVGAGCEALEREEARAKREDDEEQPVRRGHQWWAFASRTACVSAGTTSSTSPTMPGTTINEGSLKQPESPYGLSRLLVDEVVDFSTAEFNLCGNEIQLDDIHFNSSDLKDALNDAVDQAIDDFFPESSFS